MTDYSLIGAYSFKPDGPCFLIPVFKHLQSNSVYMQDVSTDGNINEFIKVNSDHFHQVNCEFFTGTYRLNDPALFAVRLSDGFTQWGTYTEICDFLRSQDLIRLGSAFFNVDAYAFSGDRDNWIRAIDVAAATFPDNIIAKQWAMTEKSVEAFGLQAPVQKAADNIETPTITDSPFLYYPDFLTDRSAAYSAWKSIIYTEVENDRYLIDNIHIRDGLRAAVTYGYKVLDKRLRQLVAMTGWDLDKDCSTTKKALDRILSRNVPLVVVPRNLADSVVSRFEKNFLKKAGSNKYLKDMLYDICDLNDSVIYSFFEMPVVFKAAITLYTDKGCLYPEKNIQGTIVHMHRPDEVVVEKVFPTPNELLEGEALSWRWDSFSTWGELYYKCPRTGESKLAFNSSQNFIGKPVGFSHLYAVDPKQNWSG